MGKAQTSQLDEILALVSTLEDSGGNMKDKSARILEGFVLHGGLL